MENRILTKKEVIAITGINPVEKGIKCRRLHVYNLYILSDVIEYLKTTLPFKRFEPINMQNGYLIVESSIN
jgi:hypothetical protein